MLVPIAALIIAITGVTARLVANRQRVSAPRPFATASLRWWFPPFPEATEFSSARARALEITGRLCTNVAAALMVVDLVARRVG
jgi:hypothetical protein